jgi:hypothetical protein
VSKLIHRIILYLWYGCLDKVTCHVLETVLGDCVKSGFGYVVVCVVKVTGHIMETVQLCF